MATVYRARPCSLHAFMPRVAQRDRRGASDEVVCVLAHAFGFESAGDYGRAMRPLCPASAPEPPEPPEPPEELERWQR